MAHFCPNTGQTCYDSGTLWANLGEKMARFGRPKSVAQNCPDSPSSWNLRQTCPDTLDIGRNRPGVGQRRPELAGFTQIGQFHARIGQTLPRSVGFAPDLAKFARKPRRTWAEIVAELGQGRPCGPCMHTDLPGGERESKPSVSVSALLEGRRRDSRNKVRPIRWSESSSW